MGIEFINGNVQGFVSALERFYSDTRDEEIANSSFSMILEKLKDYEPSRLMIRPLMKSFGDYLERLPSQERFEFEVEEIWNTKNIHLFKLNMFMFGLPESEDEFYQNM